MDPDGREVKAVNQTSARQLRNAISNTFSTGAEIGDPTSFVYVDRRGTVQLNGVRDNKGRFTKEFKAALSTLNDKEVQSLLVEFVETVESDKMNYVEVITNEKAKEQGTNTQQNEFLFYTGDRDKTPENSSSTYQARNGQNASLTVTATEGTKTKEDYDHTEENIPSLEGKDGQSTKLIQGVVKGEKGED